MDTKDIDYDKCMEIMNIFNNIENIECMRNCLYKFVKISLQFPPQKNENKFIYGKLGELTLLETLKELKLSNLVELDKNKVIGSEYKNDIQIDNTKFSIKVKLNKNGNIIMVNYNSRKEHILDVNTIIVIINEKKIYIIPKTFDTKKFIKIGAGNISYSSSIITHIHKNNPEFIFTFPDLSQEQQDIIDNMNEVDIFTKLYNDYIH